MSGGIVRWFDVEGLDCAHRYSTGAYFATLHIHFHAQASLEDRPYHPRACTQLGFELTINTASEDRTVYLLDQHKVAGSGHNPSGWSHVLCVGHPSQIDPIL